MHFGPVGPGSPGDQNFAWPVAFKAGSLGSAADSGHLPPSVPLSADALAEEDFAGPTFPFDNSSPDAIFNFVAPTTHPGADGSCHPDAL